MARIVFSTLVLLFASPALAATPRWVASRDVIVNCRVANGAAVDRVTLWWSADRGRSWHALESPRGTPDALHFDAPRDGRYEFYVVLSNAAGVSGPPPHPGSVPHATVIVDTTPPLLQLHAADCDVDADGERLVRLRVSLIEEHLHDAGVHVFYRASPTTLWHDGGPISLVDGEAHWPAPAQIGDEIELELVTADLAGNRVSSAARPVRMRPPQCVTTVPPDPPTAQAEPAVAAPPPPLPEMESPRVQKLRTLADQHLAAGRYGLAEARLNDALDEAPGDPDVLLSLGEVLFRAKRYSDAERRFRTALEHSPDNERALEGLALVANTARRYPEAREHLQRLLRQRPAAGHTWLRLGDVEHRLGRRTEAVDAWRKAVEMTDAKSDIHAWAQDRLRLFGLDRTQTLIAATP